MYACATRNLARRREEKGTRASSRALARLVQPPRDYFTSQKRKSVRKFDFNAVSIFFSLRFKFEFIAIYSNITANSVLTSSECSPRFYSQLERQAVSPRSELSVRTQYLLRFNRSSCDALHVSRIYERDIGNAREHRIDKATRSIPRAARPVSASYRRESLRKIRRICITILLASDRGVNKRAIAPSDR